MEQSQTANTLVGDAHPDYVELPNEFFDSYTVEQYRGFLPKKDQAVFSPWARAEMLTNDDYLTEVVNNIYAQDFEQNPEMKTYYEENPSAYQDDYNKVKSGIYQNLTKEVFKGENVNQAIKKREHNLLFNGMTDISDFNLPNVLENNKSKYQELGFLDSEGNQLLDGEAAKFKILQDEKLVQSFTEDFYKSFEEEIANQHNAGVIDKDNVDQMAQAFVAFREFNKEGLTNYINYISEYDFSKPLEEQTPAAKKAKKFIDSAKKNGKTIKEHIGDFYGSEDSPVGKFTLTLPKASKEMLENIPRDYSPYTAYMNYSHGDEKEGIKNFIKETREQPEEFSWGLFVNSIVDKFAPPSLAPVYSDDFKNASKTKFYNFEAGREATIFGSLAGMFTDEENYYEAATEDIMDSIESGNYDHNLRNVIYNVVDEAEKGEKFNYTDIMRSVLLHAEPNSSIQEEMGADMSKRDLYTLNLKEVPHNIRIGVEALRHSQGQVVRQGRNPDEVIIEPNYSERLNKTSWLSDYLRNNVEYEFKPIYDEEGKLAGGEPVPAKDNFWQNNLFGRALASLSLFDEIGSWVQGKADNPVTIGPMGHGALTYFTEWVDGSLFRPGMDTIEQAIRRNELEDSMVGKGFFATKRSYEQTIGQALDVEPPNERPLDQAMYTAGYMGGYLWSSYQIGNASMSLLGKAKTFQQFSNFNKTRNAQQVLSFMQPKPYTRMGNLAQAISKVSNKAVGGAAKGMGTFAKIEAGEIVRQPITPPEMSIFQLGKVSQEMFGTDTGDITKSYERSNRIAQVGADMVANGLLSVAFDNILASTRFFGNKFAMKAFGKKTGASYKLNQIGEYKALPKEKYTLDTGYSPDMRRFWNEVTNEVANIPQGNIEETLKNYYSGRNVGAIGQNAKTLTDVTQRFKEDGDLYMDGLWDNIRNTLRSYDENHGAGPDLSESLDSRTTQIYENTLDYVAEELYHGLKESDDVDLAFRFAQSLKQSSPTSDYIPFVGSNGVRNYQMSLDNAQALHNLKPNSTVIKNEDGSYSVASVKDNYWGIKLGNKIQKKYADNAYSDRASDYLKSQEVDTQSINPKEQNKQYKLLEEFNNYYNKPVNINGRQGVITGLDKDRAIVTFADGSTAKTAKSNIDDQIRNIEEYTEEAQRAKQEAEDIKQKAKAKKQAEQDTKEGEEIIEEFKNVKEKQAKNTKNTETDPDFKETLRKKDDTFKRYGVTNTFWNGLKKVFDYKARGKSTFRKVLSSIGHSGAIDYRAVGKNKGPIEYLDMKKVKKSGGLDKNVVFKIKSSDGIDEHYIVVEKTPEEFSPSVWTEIEGSKGLVMNPYIRRIETNATFKNGEPVLYKPIKVKSGGDDVRLYVPAKRGEEGVVLNVQKPIRSSEDINLQKIKDNNNDAISYEVNGKTAYRLISETDQVIEPAKFKGGKANNKVVQLEEYPIPTREELEKHLKNTKIYSELGKANAAVAPAVGFIIDMMEYGWNDEDFEGGVPWTMVGLGLSTGKFYLKSTGKIKGTVRSNIKNLWDNSLAPTIRKSDNQKENLKRMGLGVEDYTSEKPDEEWLDGVTKAFDLTGKGVTSIAKAITHNRVVQSMFMRLRTLNVEKADEFLNALMTIDRTIGKIFSNPERRFQNAVFNQEVKRIAKEQGIPEKEAQDLVNPNYIKDQWKSFIYGSELSVDEIQKAFRVSEVEAQQIKEIGEGPALVKRFFESKEGGDWNNNYIQRQFNMAVARVLDLGADKPDDVLGKAKNKAVRAMYQGSYGNTYRELDRMLLENDKFVQLIRTQRDSYNDVLDRYTSALDDYVNRRYENMLDSALTNKKELAEMANDFYGSRKTPHQYRVFLKKQKIPEKEIKKQLALFTKLRELPEWKDFEYASYSARKLTDLRGKYSPHIFGRDAEIRAKENFIKNKNPEVRTTFKYLDEPTQERFLETQGISREEAIRRDPEVQANVSNLTPDGRTEAWDQEVISMFIRANASDDKLNRLKSMNDVGEMSDQTFETLDDVETQIHIIQHRLNQRGYYDEAKQVGEQWSHEKIMMEKDGKMTEAYVISLPDELAYGIRGVNRDTLSTYYKSFKESLKSPRSNHLDRPRVSNIPYELRELDLDRIRHRYSKDTGRRIHAMENNMMNHDEASEYYIEDILEQLKQKDVHSKERQSLRVRLRDTYHIAFGEVGEDMADYTRFGQKSLGYSIYRNLQFLRFGYGFGPYNLFEWAAVGSHLSGGGRNIAQTLFSTDTTRAENLEQLLEHENIFRRLIEYARPEFQEFGVYDYGLDDWMAKVDYKTSNWANKVGDFSVGRLMGAEHLWDAVPASRLLPIFGESFLGSSMFASGMIARASMGEAMFLGNMLKRLKNLEPDKNGVRMLKERGRQWTIPEVERLMENIGIPKKKQEMFSNGTDTFKNLVHKLDTDPNFNSKIGEFRDPTNIDKATQQNTSEYMDALVDIARTSVQSYNGINKLYRPELWHSNIGRTLSMYSTYPMNAGVQILQRRIRQPIAQWYENHGKHVRQAKSLSAMEMWFYKQTGNTDALIKKGYSKEAIEEFPSEAAHAILRTFNSLGVTIPGYMSIEALKDIVDWSLSPVVNAEAEFEGDWERLNRQMILNPMAPEEQQVTIQSLADESGLTAQKIHAMVRYGLYSFGRMGAAGRWLEPWSNPGLQYYGAGSLSPIMGDIDTLSKISGRLAWADPSQYNESIPNFLAQQLISYTPIIGSSIFSKARGSLIDNYFKKARSNSTVNGQLVF